MKRLILLSFAALLLCGAALAQKPTYELADQFSDYFVNFLRTGDPNGSGLDDWQASQSGFEVLELGDRTEMRTDPFLQLCAILDRMQGWEK